jgi:hypothetical protein
MEISLGNFQINSLNKFSEENLYDEYKMDISDMKFIYLSPSSLA